jgi:tRNA G46 methylase TrmB
MAQAFPESRFVGFDYHAPSVTVATQRAEEGGVAGRRDSSRHGKELPRQRL